MSSRAWQPSRGGCWCSRAWQAGARFQVNQNHAQVVASRRTAVPNLVQVNPCHFRGVAGQWYQRDSLRAIQKNDCGGVYPRCDIGRLGQGGVDAGRKWCFTVPRSFLIAQKTCAFVSYEHLGTSRYGQIACCTRSVIASASLRQPAFVIVMRLPVFSKNSAARSSQLSRLGSSWPSTGVPAAFTTVLERYTAPSSPFGGELCWPSPQPWHVVIEQSLAICAQVWPAQE